MSRPEQAIQRTIVQGLRACLPHGWLVHHSANKPRSMVAGAIEKSMGAMKGFPDLIILGRQVSGPDAEGAMAYFVEVKAPTGRRSPEQIAVADALQDLGFPYGVARSWDDVVALAAEWKWPWRAAR